MTKNGGFTSSEDDVTVNWNLASKRKAPAGDSFLFSYPFSEETQNEFIVGPENPSKQSPKIVLNFV
jgi:hypothetical protein